MKIAVTDNGNEGKRKLYLDWLNELHPEAEVSVISYSTHSGDDLKDFDGILLTGGEDVNAERSRAIPKELVGIPNLARDEFELKVIDSAVKQNIPIFGICRGLQIANVYFGGTLIADLEFSGFRKHKSSANEPEHRHKVQTVERTIVQELGGTQGEINSYHHQAVDRVGNELIASSFSDDHVVESLEWKNKSGRSFLLLVQWHPERMMDKKNPFAVAIGKRFINEIQESITLNLKPTQ